MQYLLDTDFLISLYFNSEVKHQQAVKIASDLVFDAHSGYTSLVLQECATVISRKYSQAVAIQISRILRENTNGVLFVSQSQMQEAWNLFEEQQDAKTSFIDCSNVVIARQLGCQILSFDKFYQQFVDVRLEV